MADFKETCIEYLDVDDVATVGSSERRWINKIIKFHEQHPGVVKIVRMPEENSGYILAHVPKSWVKLSPPKQVNLTDEQRAARAERLRKSRTQTDNG